MELRNVSLRQHELKQDAELTCEMRCVGGIPISSWFCSVFSSLRCAICGSISCNRGPRLALNVSYFLCVSHFFTRERGGWEELTLSAIASQPSISSASSSSSLGTSHCLSSSAGTKRLSKSADAAGGRWSLAVLFSFSARDAEGVPARGRMGRLRGPRAGGGMGVCVCLFSGGGARLRLGLFTCTGGCDCGWVCLAND